MDGAAIRRARTTLLSKLSSPEQQSDGRSTGERTTLFDAIQEDSADDARAQQTEDARPMRVSLMTLLSLGDAAHAKEADPTGDRVSVTDVREEEEEAAPMAEITFCCVCMVRRKGAAFIPCGHTFCRACSRELVAGRGHCPVCNEAIFDVLHIF